MDDLIKGLVDVALGGGHGRDRDNREEEGQSRDVPSGTSWAKVVSGDQDNDDQERRHDPWNRQAVHGGYEENEGCQRHDFKQNNWNKEEKKEENNDGWETVGKKPNREEKKEENIDGWETVGKKPSRRHRKVQKDQWQGYKKPPSEQQYSDEVEIGSSLEPSDEELADFKLACDKLWELDLNRLVPGKDYEIDCGEGKKVYQKEDMAEGGLFSWLSEDVFRKPTFSRFCSLLDNYNPNQWCKEVITSEEKQEQAAFIEEICRTAPIKFLHKYLSSKNIVSGSYSDFKRTMTSLWFDFYGRGGTSGSSSAFEHVFVGEIKQCGEQEVSGFHNWLQFYLEEAKGNVDYQGYIFPQRRGQIPDSKTQLLTIQFEWNGILKSVSSTFVGVSPEFEIALYTLCFFLGGEDNHIQVGPYPVNIKCYRHGDRIGSVFPIAEC